ncbi:tetratricopeptide repeat protein [Caldilinea sp.]|uniref:tetratricopeptide repeat protein n=1 Tax=Caldilinea sp. TaxID=2293560 RepID=UPI002B6A5D95|nr:tetratricopeptide repeat protein [Caldilinea sp.]
MVNSLEQFVESGHISNNLTFYRLNGFVGSRRHLLTIHEWLTGGDDLPAIAISGEQGAGKSTLAVASAWNHYYDFSDGIIQVSPAGASPFRLYDVVRTMDTVLGTALTRTSDNRWGISILEQLYKRRRLLILDKLAGASEREVATLVEIIGHLHENEGQSRIILIDRKFNPNIAALVQHQHLHLDGILREDLDAFVAARAPQRVLTAAHAHAEAIYAAARGNPICMRLIFGLMEEFPFSELDAIFRGISGPDGGVPASSICAFALETYALQNPAAGVFLNRLVRAVGGVYEPALRELFWADLGSHEDYAHTVSALADRALIERDRFRGRVVIHPLVRRYLEENTAMLGEEWDRRHAAFYVKQAEQYQMLPLQRWSEVDLDWGNIFAGADWCSNRLTRIFQREPEAMLSDDAAEITKLAPQDTSSAVYADLRLAVDYALALAHYAFWRHPPGILRWLTVGAVAALATQNMRDYAWLLTNMGQQYFFLGRVEEGIGWLQRAAPIFDERDLLADLAYVYTDLGTSHRILDELRRALEYFTGAFNCVAQLGDQHGLATAYMNLGSAYFSLNQPERALAEHRRSLRIALRGDDKHLLASIYNNVGLVLEALERYDEAIEAYEYALTMFNKNEDLTGVSACYNNLGSVCYARGDFAQAHTWYTLDMVLLRKRGAWTDLAATLHNLGHVALAQDALDQASAYFAESRDLYTAFDLRDYASEEEEMLRDAQTLRANKTLMKR